MSLTKDDIMLCKERLADLRSEKSLTLNNLHDEILKTQDVNISKSMLGDYEDDASDSGADVEARKAARVKNMRLENMVALADYYHVPIEYLIGRSNVRRPENLDTYKQLHLSESAVENIRKLYQSDKHHAEDESYTPRLDILSELLSDERFFEFLNFVAEGYALLDSAIHFHESTFWDESGDYSEDLFAIQNSNLRDYHIMDSDYLETARFQFYNASATIQVILQSRIDDYERMIGKTPFAYLDFTDLIHEE